MTVEVPAGNIFQFPDGKDLQILDEGRLPNINNVRMLSAEGCPIIGGTLDP